MGYSIFKFGAIHLSNKILCVPQNPKEGGDIPQCTQRFKISIETESECEAITWIKPNGMNIFVADRVLLGNITWNRLKKDGFVAGKEIVINNQRFSCRLPRLRATDNVERQGKILSLCEWDKILNETGDNDFIWNWKRAYFWGTESWGNKKTTAMFCGYHTPTFKHQAATTQKNEYLGLRPVLDPLGSNGPFLSLKLDGVNFQLSSIPGGWGFCPILKPASKDVFADIQDGYQVRMYTLVEGERPVHISEPGKDPAQLVLTDRYFGDEYLIPWTISKGIAMADRALCPPI